MAGYSRRFACLSLSVILLLFVGLGSAKQEMQNEITKTDVSETDNAAEDEYFEEISETKTTITSKTEEPAVTMEDALLTLSENNYLDDGQKERIAEYLICLNEKLPDVDYSFLNYNLKNLKIEMVDDPKDIDYSYGMFKCLEDILYFASEDYYNNDVVFYHELTHVLTEKMQPYISEGFRGLHNYGAGINEARAELISMYLTDPEINDFDAFLSQDHVDTFSYPGILTNTTFDLMKFTKNELDAYDYLFGDVYRLRRVLRPYGLNNIIDCLDEELKTFSDYSYIPDRTLLEENTTALELLLENKWADAYISYLNSVGRFNYSNGALIYVNADIIPEVVLTGSNKAAGSIGLTLSRDNEVKEHVFNSNLKYIPHENVMYDSGAADEEIDEEITCIRNGSWETLVENDYVYSDAISVDSEMIYTIDELIEQISQLSRGK